LQLEKQKRLVHLETHPDILNLNSNSPDNKVLPDGLPIGNTSTGSPFLHRKAFCVWPPMKVRRSYTGHHC